MFNSNLTLVEQERNAYISGDTQLAIALQRAHDAEKASESAEDAESYIHDAKASIPDEDFLQEFITKLQNIAKRRVTKEDVLFLANELEDFEKEMAGTFEYMHDQLKQASDALP